MSLVIYGIRFIKKRFRRLMLKFAGSEYALWIKMHEVKDKGAIKRQLSSLKYKPKISIIVPVYNVDPQWLDKCIESVLKQTYNNWELCIHDDASTNEKTVEDLKRWQAKDDKRIKVSFGKTNMHISGASNEALKLATGEFIALLDNDDELAPNAFLENVLLLNKHKDADFIYSDEDKIGTNGKRYAPFFKPEWSPDLMLSQMYTCHLGVYRKSIIDKIGGFRLGYEGSQDYDLVLRFVEHTTKDKIHHIPKILYHWRTLESSTAASLDTKSYASVAAKKTLTDYLRRNKVEGMAIDGIKPGTFRVKREIMGQSKVSIIIPFRDQVEVLKRCLKSIEDKTTYSNYEIILVNNQSSETATLNYFTAIKRMKNIRLINYDKPFNYSAINNSAARHARGDYLILLNNDTEVISGEWIEAMLEHAQRKEVGIVGAKLLYPNNTIQHAGVVMGIGGVAGHVFKYMNPDTDCYFCNANLVRNYSAVTAACLMIRKSVYEEVGGLDEINLTVAFNDVDMCLKVIDSGYLVIYTPYALLYHHESLSRGSDDELRLTNPKKFKRVMKERKYMEKKWKRYIERDIYYSPNLSLVREDLSINID
ncbi:MAG: Glycosyl transferase family 2 [candidate division CPR2 bacterium GW2011_GWC1_41_48]|uniref:Glycosyl transferase family 2 n=1 Tax=candidate division CPR2 bacterium GW2011_GWC1_41_48 TaxID=1618344 RepID=A0A0G0W9H4_UNCC2|nr:MAG: Glycosyl transferase family 2 [candidate division CPR2 bacterium GW2011_GWC2_39_35]KKR28743.1 MAG: Glycosyl transferase family 2 [candidate division CPR2 bacterium GW2011_GWD2_39_7]KKS09600.1 MAG: Glycosyl transferase family 2 [candidate division CPR2 bacterium GW2011_GWC1_41_48]